MEDGNRSTTPPLPPPESSETLQPAQQPSQSPPRSPQPELQGGAAGPVETEGQDKRMDPDSHQSRLPRPANSKTPEPRIITIHQQTNGTNGHGPIPSVTNAAHLAPERSATPATPGTIPSFDWDDLEARFEKALADVNGHEQELMAEFEALVKYFNVWASAASAHDNERAAKRLQTRTQFVKLKEANLADKRQYYDQVMQAFQSAMLLLRQA